MNREQSLDVLRELGCQVKKIDTSSTSSFEISGIPISSSTKLGETYELTLPSSSKVEASFSPEGLGKKLLKVFTKEMQTGDAEFDAKVFIATKSADTTAALLANENVRGSLFNIIAQGGMVAFSGSSAKFVYADLPSEEDILGMTRVVQAVL